LYYGVSICLVSFASAMAVVTLNIHHRGVRGNEVPDFVRAAVLGWLSRFVFLHFDGSKNSNVNRRTNRAFQETTSSVCVSFSPLCFVNSFAIPSLALSLSGNFFVLVASGSPSPRGNCLEEEEEEEERTLVVYEAFKLLFSSCPDARRAASMRMGGRGRTLLQMRKQPLPSGIRRR